MPEYPYSLIRPTFIYQYIMSSKTEAEALKAEGNKLVQQRNWAAAAKKYEKATAIDPSCAIYWSNLALCYSKMDLLIEYKTAATKTVKADPSFVKGYVRLANAHHRLFLNSKMKWKL